MFQSVLIANRGEIAIRIARACADLAIRSVAVYSRDDVDALHVVKADVSAVLDGEGPSAYLDGPGLIAAAKRTGCDAIHPGYGFLSENTGFARLCADAGLVFIGPSPACLALFGDKAKALAHAASTGAPVARSSGEAVGLEAGRAYAASFGGGVLIKAAAGGGGRGMRVVRDMAGFDEAWQRCASEAKRAFGSADLYVEEMIERARHIEVQVLGDRSGRLAHLFERDCSVQRRFQKIIEIAPSPWLSDEMRKRLIETAIGIVERLDYVGLGTIEFLVEIDERGHETGRFVFIEMNPRLQVEHTVTEEVTGVDLVQTQIKLAAGTTLDQLGYATTTPTPRGYALQLRVNMEDMSEDGIARMSSGALSTFDPPSGAGIRIETAGHRGYTANPSFDLLLAKVVIRSASSEFKNATRRAYRSLCEFDIGGAQTNLALLQNILLRPEFVAGLIDTRFVEAHAKELIAVPSEIHPGFRRPVDNQPTEEALADDNSYVADGVLVRSPMRGRLLSIDVNVGDRVRSGHALLVVEAMKMEHSVVAEVAGVVTEVLRSAGDSLRAGSPLLVIAPGDLASDNDAGQAEATTGAMESLEVLLEQRAALLDAARPDAVAAPAHERIVEIVRQVERGEVSPRPELLFDI